ncbi:hypothetical protein GF340_01440 [Candidatus Peregrinibacteria bacterium]|nr:hypothetical protein [Candidatus Peregrinibacteria bacterium]
MSVNILVVDENAIQLVEKVMEGLNGEINEIIFNTAQSALDALLIAKKKNVHIAIINSDVEYPGDGFEIAFDLKMIDSEIRLFGYSSNWDEASARHAGLEGFAAYGEDLISFIKKQV